jgi:hypothetical protein
MPWFPGVNKYVDKYEYDGHVVMQLYSCGMMSKALTERRERILKLVEE